MTLLENLTQGLEPYGKPERIIETLVSKVFVFEDKVLKIYKKDKYFFEDLETFETRKAFYEEDFFWNNNASPEVYLHLWGVVKSGDAFEFVTPNLGEDFVIEMSRIDDEQTLYKVLNRNEISHEQASDFIDSLVGTLAALKRERRVKLDHLFRRGLYNIMVDNTQSLYDWMITEKSFDKNEATKVLEVLKEGLEKVPYFKETEIEELSVAFDNNCDNLILLNGRPSYIDILSPMEVWRVVDEYATIARTIVDIEVLQDMETGKVARESYAKYGRTIPKVAMLMHEVRAAAIQWPYRYMLNQPEIAEKYGEYTRKKVEELKSELVKM